MPLKIEGFEPIQGQPDDPRRRAGEPPRQAPGPPQKEIPADHHDTAPPAAPVRTVSPRPRSRTRTEGTTQDSRTIRAVPGPDTVPAPAANVYARAGRPVQVAVSLYVPMWERAEEHCDELRAQRIAGATLTAWVSALLHFRAPTDPQAIRELASRWRRIEADDRGPYAGLRKQARGIRLFEPLWERQRAAVNQLRRASNGEPRPNLAMWTCAVCHAHAPRTTDEARELLRDWRLLLAGDEPAANGAPAPPNDS